ncbi:MAG: hypothetical protein SWJ54_05990 [Cyanobacteriota bacterium]|nr:hypothetical protein [Cyanobacteriota bacterium]
MTSNYTSEEISAIAQLPMITGMAVAMVDLGIVSVAIEAAALSKEVAEVAKKYPNNSIIQSAFSVEAIKSGSVKMEKPEVKPEEVKSGALVDKAITSINNTLNLLQGKATPEEIQQYKNFIYNCCEAVANAAGRGLFGSGQKVTKEEAIALKKFKIALA